MAAKMTAKHQNNGMKSVSNDIIVSALSA